MNSPMSSTPRALSRRDFITTTSLAAAALALPRSAANAAAAPAGPAPLIDIHMHQNVGGGQVAVSPGAKSSASSQRVNDDFFRHQQNIGAVTTVLLGSNDRTIEWAKKDSKHWVCFCREPVNVTGAHVRMERLLKAGAIGLGECKDAVACDSPEMIKAVELAKEYDVPIMMHFEDGAWNDGYSRFHKVVEKFPTVKFIGHAQTFWANVNKAYSKDAGQYPTGSVTPGGLTDVWLKTYPNLYADMSAGSGNNALMRDVEFAKAFVVRHQDKLMFGSDCPCKTGVGPTCVSATKIAAIEKLALDETVRTKILQSNARKLLKLA